MADYIVQEPARTEDGQFIVTLTSEEGYTLAQGVGETFEEALEHAKSQL
jgi:predicted RNase H-like HicB family nuclease